MKPKRRGKINYAWLVGKKEKLTRHYSWNDYFKFDKIYHYWPNKITKTATYEIFILTLRLLTGIM